MHSSLQIKISCDDRPGIIAAITSFIHGMGGNILDLNHHTEEQSGLFFLLCDFVFSREAVSKKTIAAKPAFKKLTVKYNWNYEIYDTSKKTPIAIFVSKTDHCLYELLLKIKDGYLNTDLRGIISNHNEFSKVAEQFGIPFFCLNNSLAQRTKEILKIIKELSVDTLVLARYMQIISPAIINKYRSKVINVHHGFLPAFKGKKPYHQAWRKGVKIIGATAHYATERLDEGPIIYQDVAAVHSNLSVEEFIETGKDIERKVLVEGLKLHLEKRVFVHEGRTIIL